MALGNLKDLNDYLFAQLDRLDNADFKDGELMAEVERAECICKVSAQIINNANTVLSAVRLKEQTLGVGNAKNVTALIGE